MTEDEHRHIAITAAEYVLGVLPFKERVGFEVRLRHDVQARHEVDYWSEHFGATFNDDFEPARPSRDLYKKIEGRVFGNAPRPSIFGRIFWPVLAGLATGAAAILFVERQGIDREPVIIFPETGSVEYVASLNNPQTGVDIVAAYDADEGLLRLARRGGEPLPDRVYELWAIIGDNAPVSLGVLPESDQIRVTVPADLQGTFDGAVLAISDEPQGGSPTGAPTGDVLAAGPISSL